jgi:hypothetical protein
MVEFGKRISKNNRCGRPICSVDRVINMAHHRKAFYHPVWGIKPAAILLNMPLFVTIKAINNRSLYTIWKSQW